MDRNTVSHFSEVPYIEIQRSVFDRSSEHKTTFNAGKLIPIYIDEVLPGDTFTFDQAMVLRMSTPLYPVMDNSFLDVYYFFVPMRLVWDKSKQFFGENDSAPWDDMDELQIPSLRVVSETVKTGSVADYFGIPVAKVLTSSGITADYDNTISALPFRAYALIWNEWFRDQNMMYPCDVSADRTGVFAYTNETFDPTNGTDLDVPARGGMPLPVAKFHDYFTSALPEPQKGDPVSFDLGSGTFPVKFMSDSSLPAGTDDYIPFFSRQSSSSKFFNLNAMKSGGITALGLTEPDPVDSYSLKLPTATDPNQASITQYLGLSSFSRGGNGSSLQGDQPVNWLRGIETGDQFSGSGFIGISSTSGTGDLPYHYVLKQMKLSSNEQTAVNAAVQLSNLGSITVNELRMSFALQRLLERDARGGTRYREIIKAHFGVTSPDARMQIPEYLGGKRIPINVSQVLQTSETTSSSPLGETGAYSLTSDSDSMFTYSATEHGFIIGVCCVRTNHTYQQGLEKMWSRKRRFDFYWPALANIGEQAILNRELYVSGNGIADAKPFGYQEAWAEYRYKPSRVSGYMRSEIFVDGSSSSTGSLDVWHYADNYDSTPTLSAGWIAETPDNIDRTLAVSSDVSHQFIADFAFRCRCARPMPVYSVPGLLDHN